MDISELQVLLQPLVAMAIDFGGKLIGAFIIWIIGRKIISLVLRAADTAMNTQKLDPTLVRYGNSTINIMLQLVLFMAILGVFGIETTTFAGVLAAGGVAIGMAWSGLLSNFAAGVFLVVLRPFKVGDMIEAGGVIGDVEEVGLFVTTINTPDNIRTFVGNAAIFNGNIRNFTANPHRRVELTAQLDHSVDVHDAIRRFEAHVANIPNVLSEPSVDVEIVTFTLAGPVLAIRPYCHNDNYWQVFFDTNKAIVEVGGAAGYAVPKQHYGVLGNMSVPAAAK